MIISSWAGLCSSVTIGSSNGWDTNFDNIVFDVGVLDLVITGFMGINGTTLQPPKLSVTIRNQGSAESGPSSTFDIHVLFDLGRPPTLNDVAYVAHVAVPKLAAGTSTTVQIDVMSNKLSAG